jgi:hypothetical protein
MSRSTKDAKPTKMRKEKDFTKKGKPRIPKEYRGVE